MLSSIGILLLVESRIALKYLERETNVMTGANTYLINCSKQEKSRAADLRLLCSKFDYNRTQLLQHVKQQLERGPSDEKIRKELEDSRHDLMSHVGLVWVRPDDVLHAQGDTMGDTPKIR
jgi:hypothetical protein